MLAAQLLDRCAGCCLLQEADDLLVGQRFFMSVLVVVTDST